MKFLNRTTVVRYRNRLDLCKSYEQTILAYFRRRKSRKPDGSFIMDVYRTAYAEGRKDQRRADREDGRGK